MDNKEEEYMYSNAEENRDVEKHDNKSDTRFWKKPNFIFICIGAAAILFNGIFNAVVYSRLPEKIATQFPINENTSGTMPKLIYLLMAFIFIAFFSIKCMIPSSQGSSALDKSLAGITKGRSQQFVSVSVVAILTVLNVMMVMAQI